MAENYDFPVTHVEKPLISDWNKICVMLYRIHKEVQSWYLVNLSLLRTGMAENYNYLAIFMRIGISHKSAY